MESEDPKKRGRGRPRKRRREEDDGNNDKSVKKVAIDLLRWKPLVGSYVLKEFDGNGIFLGKIVYYDSGLYRVDYEDGDCEDLESKELRHLILKDDDFNHDLMVRRKRLDELVLRKKKDQEEKKLQMETPVAASDGLLPDNGGEDNEGESEGDDDSSSHSCEHIQEQVEVPLVPPPELPPSSGNVGVPVEHVPLLFSVFTFLRSFNIRLFLSPFALDDLVGAINCCVQNTLIDAIHFVLLRTLRRHLEMLSSDASESASKCLRCADWSLLDSLTWPIYLVHYFSVMGYAKGTEWKGFHDLWKMEYYTLPVGMKLMILQILCDDVLESMEVRVEIDMREEAEFGMDPDAPETSCLENGPRRVHPRYSKTSACKDREAMEIIARSQGTKSSISRYPGSRSTEGHTETSDVDIDGNGDECRLCGMDGTLLCCDGCPSSYHARCIGVVKMYIPDGPWYCPECTINKLGPTITMGTSLKGAVIFGIDVYEQVFLGTWDHLLVLTASINSSACLRYYSPVDIPKVLQALSSSVQHRSLYSEICNAVAQHWHVPHSAFYLLDTRESSNVAHIPAAEAEKAIGSTGSCVDNVVLSFLDPSVGDMIQADSQGIVCNGDLKSMQSCHLMYGVPNEQIKLESAGSINQQVDPLDVANQSLVDGTSATEVTTITTSTSTNSVGSHIGLVNGTCLPTVISSRSKEGIPRVFVKVEGNSVNNCSYVGTFFKPHAYINQYMHGDFAASAASKLAVLSSEESRVSEGHKSSSKKAVSDILLQVKAFSMAASRFFWPSSEKKLIEVPRERCGWCHSCKLASSTRRGCMLNAAALAATKGAVKILSGLRPAMNGDGTLPSISAYILYMGEILCGLTIGSFLSANYYREKWRKQVESASTCSALKGPLLELEKNIRIIALSGDWIKAMDEWLVDSSIFQSSTSIIGTMQKRGPNGKRYRKQSVITDVATVGFDDKSFIWWRGGTLSKLLFHKAILPRSAVRRAAKQGGSRKISGIHYADDTEVPKRSRQLYWRAAVERIKNSSQLALQVRYLDLHIRWNDLIRPEQNIQEGKGSETEASVFRNAIICDKKMEGNKIRYGVAFGSQKHLPSRIMKTVIEVAQSEDGKEKYWFSEMHVPLYLIKEYEVSVVGEAVSAMTVWTPNELSERRKKQLKAFRRDTFSYLTFKRDQLDNCSCTSCQCDVSLRDTVKCSACQGYCHVDCTVTSAIDSNEEVEFLITCKLCYNAKAVSCNEKSNESTTSTLLLQGRQCHNAVAVKKGTVVKLHNPAVGPIRIQESSCETKKATSTSSSAKKDSTKCNWGVIWKKKNIDDTGIDFRHNNILLRGGLNRWPMCDEKNCKDQPSCNLCRKKYTSDLIYIHCETCHSWFHAEAVGLDESKISDVAGFKCCRCRRIKSPECPYADASKDKKQGTASSKRKRKKDIVQLPPEQENQGSAELYNRVLMEGNAEVDFGSGCIVESKEVKPITKVFPEEGFVQDDDPLLFSVSKVEQITEPNSGADFECNFDGQGPQKLPVRRQSRHNGDFESSMSYETNHLMKHEEEMPSCLEWGTSGSGIEGEMLNDCEGLNFEDMEFEPQTYFSFTELLLPDDDCQLDGFSDYGNLSAKFEIQPCEVATDMTPQWYTNSTGSDQQKHSAVNSVPCSICSHVEPAPDLSCKICGIVIHHHCSRWIESSPIDESGWMCGNCREWR